MACKFGTIALGKDVDHGKCKKLAQRVEEALSQESLFVAPKQIDPSLILVSLTSRDGAPPNVQHVHYGLLQSFMTKGFYRSRFAIAICIKYTSEHGKALVMDHHKRFSKGNKRLPPSMRRQCMDPWQVRTTTWPCGASRQVSIHPLGLGLI